MDFNDTPEQAAFRAEVRSWLEANASPKGESQDSLFSARTDEAAHVAAAQAWQKKKAEAGWAAIHWPEEYGGRGASPMETVIYREEEARFDVPQGPSPSAWECAARY